MFEGQSKLLFLESDVASERIDLKECVEDEKKC